MINCRKSAELKSGLNYDTPRYSFLFQYCEVLYFWMLRIFIENINFPFTFTAERSEMPFIFICCDELVADKEIPSFHRPHFLPIWHRSSENSSLDSEVRIRQRRLPNRWAMGKKWPFLCRQMWNMSGMLDLIKTPEKFKDYLPSGQLG